MRHMPFRTMVQGEEVRFATDLYGADVCHGLMHLVFDKPRLAPGVQRSEGSSPLGRISRHELVCGRSVRILTMMQSCASAWAFSPRACPVGKLRAAGPFSLSASVPCLLPVPAASDRQSAVRPERQRERRVGKEMLFLGPFSLPDAR
jgi:hypothetical protein